MKNEGIAVRLGEQYSKNPMIRTLVQLIPFGIGAGIDVGISTAISNIKEERLRVFFTELESQQLTIDDKLIDSNDFLHAYFATVNSVLKTKRKEKIVYFARLLTSAVKYDVLFDESDIFEDYLKVLDDLTFKEIILLSLIEKYEKANPIEKNENELQRSSRFWNNFIEEAQSIFGVSPDEINGWLQRLNRTGCYSIITGAYFDYGGDQGKLTPIYYKIQQLIEVK